ncbi:MAG: hypothetical protein SWJ54_06600 [Cyanobacteriota bacterium]|nr:hypothetical protein [Cyanobacteriota bacterium]
MTEQEIINKLCNFSSDFLQKTYFAIIEGKFTQHPLHQAIVILDPNAQIRILSAINGEF